MKFDTLDKKMRVYETNMDQTVLPGLYMIARLDGRGFTKLTKEQLALERPFDERFRDAMIDTVKHTMDCGFRVVYGFTQSDEISLLFHRLDDSFGRKTRKLISILSGEASARFTLAMGSLGVFDCRIIPLPSSDLVVDYFRWRSEDAHRNALSAWCYWKMRDTGASVNEATEALKGRSTAEKNELLFQLGINFNTLPAWQKRGIGFYYERFDKVSTDSLKNIPCVVSRTRLVTDTMLPVGANYDLLVRSLLEEDA
ncbi:tRNA(His) guanylyltransferase Thg1 family protein [Chryseolinea lacunae]|uniref:tRNA(His) guanylyltransferase n=1 Tax=Chryseolinea lacunae TaxID=2801331 RepID=A0ABS1KPR5_9BACT|nr:tRNA(His) guanylyltransferase Thg1 family protein [Chryseolinea lacunae]MBL0741464.1 guanylyltransferase [Chryseolinea lacunae]